MAFIIANAILFSILIVIQTTPSLYQSPSPSPSRLPSPSPISSLLRLQYPYSSSTPPTSSPWHPFFPSLGRFSSPYYNSYSSFLTTSYTTSPTFYSARYLPEVTSSSISSCGHFEPTVRHFIRHRLLIHACVNVPAQCPCKTQDYSSNQRWSALFYACYVRFPSIVGHQRDMHYVLKELWSHLLRWKLSMLASSSFPSLKCW